MQIAPNSARIAVVEYEGVQLATVLGLVDLFAVANRQAATEGGGRIDCTVVPAWSALPQEVFDAIVVPPNLCGKRGAGDVALHAWLRAQHQGGTTLCSACAGAFWLGHAGVLDGRPATTHWALEDEFRAAFPRVEVTPEQIVVDDGDIVTAGGVMAWQDLGLALISRFLGREVTTVTCRYMLIDPAGREQRNYRSFRPRRDHGDGAILALQAFIEQNIASPMPVRALAAHSRLAPRTLQRRFQAATGLSISGYLQSVRIEKARGLLERTRMPVAEIGWAVGYEDPAAFSRLFKSISGLTASEYRKRFSVFGKG